MQCPEETGVTTSPVFYSLEFRILLIHSFPLRKQKRLPQHLSNLNSPHIIAHMEMVSLVPVRAHHNASVKILLQDEIHCHVEYRTECNTKIFPRHLINSGNHLIQLTGCNQTINGHMLNPRPHTSRRHHHQHLQKTQPQSTFDSLRKITYNVPSKSAQHKHDLSQPNFRARSKESTNQCNKILSSSRQHSPQKDCLAASEESSIAPQKWDSQSKKEMQNDNKKKTNLTLLRSKLLLTDESTFHPPRFAPCTSISLQMPSKKVV